jgi:hypothetical protein
MTWDVGGFVHCLRDVPIGYAWFLLRSEAIDLRNVCTQTRGRAVRQYNIAAAQDILYRRAPLNCRIKK